MIQKLILGWDKLPAPLKKWLKGAEVAIVTAIVTAYAVAPAVDFGSKESIAKFAAGIAGTAYAALRLYLTEAPLAAVVTQIAVEETNTPTVPNAAAPAPLVALPADHGTDG